MEPEPFRQVRRARNHTIIDVINGKPRLGPGCIYTQVLKVLMTVETMPREPDAEEDADA